MKRKPVFFASTSCSVLVTVLLLGATGCREAPPPTPLAQRLVDVFDPGFVTGTVPGESLDRTEWRFELAGSESPTLGWERVEGVESLEVRDGMLVGRTTNALPILRAVRRGGEEDPDLLHELRIRLRASAGTDVAAHFVGPVAGPMDNLQARRFFWNARAPILADGEMRTYSFQTVYPVASSGIREVFLRPSNVTGAEFAIESIRLVFRREHLAEHPSGIGWYGLGGEFREAVAIRAPQTISWPVKLPDRPRLEIGLGTLGEQPVSFKVSLATTGSETVLVEHTPDTPDRWEDVGLDLDDHAGEEVILVFALEAPSGTPGLWGTPAVRRRVGNRVAAGPGADVQGVILVLADTLRSDRLSFYGHDRLTAPQLGELASQGVLFRDAHSHAPWTRPAAPSILTSLYPLTHNLRGFLDRLPSSAVTLAEVYRGAGWATTGFSAVPHTGTSANMHQGYESLHEGIAVGGSKTARAFVDRLLPWISDHRQTPFFVFFHLFDPHFPYEPPPPYDTEWADPAGREEHQRQFLQVGQAIADPLQGAQGMASREEMALAGVEPAAYVEYRQAWYDGSIRSMDTELGRLFEHLRELGLADRTLVAFTSDHGEEFLDHDWMGHGQSLYDELIHVPLFLWKPGLVPSGTVIDEPVQHVDLMPTLLELSGLPVPEGAQGQSLVPLLKAAGSPDRDPSKAAFRPKPVVSERPVTDHPMTPQPQQYGSIALIFDGWKLIHHGEGRDEKPEYELYHHRDDPHDTNDLAAERPEVVARLKEVLASWRLDAGARQLASDVDFAGDLSAEELQRLRSLGYIE